MEYINVGSLEIKWLMNWINARAKGSRYDFSQLKIQNRYPKQGAILNRERLYAATIESLDLNGFDP